MFYNVYHITASMIYFAQNIYVYYYNIYIYFHFTACISSYYSFSVIRFLGHLAELYFQTKINYNVLKI